MSKNVDVRKDPKSTPEQRRTADQLSEADLEQIDRQILENASREWSKVARIVLTTMIERGDGTTGLPETFYSQRIANLVKEGLLESRGDLTDMNLSEVRLVEKVSIH